MQNTLISTDFSNSSVNDNTLPNKNLKITSLNVGYRVMSNEVKGSEAVFVKLCKETYPKYHGWQNNREEISNCTYNTAKYLTDYNLFGMQELNREFQREFQDEIYNLGRSKGRNYRFFSNLGDFAVVVGYDKDVMGEGIRITPDNFVFGEGNNMRGMQAIYFPLRNLLFVNLHAPHNIDLIRGLNNAFQYISQLFLQRFGKYDTRVIVVGDFNDYKGVLASRNNILNILGKYLNLHGEAPRSCCADTNYKYPGDYIFDTQTLEETIQKRKAIYFGFPLDYHRKINLYSDHDPVVLLEVDDLGGMILEGVITDSNNFIKIDIKGLDTDMVLEIAKIYLKNRGINWKVNKPLYETHYNGLPHVTLTPTMRKYLGQKVLVKLGKLYHYSSEHNWVMISVEIPEIYECVYRCHISLAEGRK